MIIYIAGPMTGMPEYNFPAFMRAAFYLRKIGHVVLNPAEGFGGNTSLPLKVYLRHDLHLLLMAEAIFLLPGWRRSKGARREYKIAKDLELQIYFPNDPL